MKTCVRCGKRKQDAAFHSRQSQPCLQCIGHEAMARVAQALGRPKG